jgi:hypothetical protein
MKYIPVAFLLSSVGQLPGLFICYLQILNHSLKAISTLFLLNLNKGISTPSLKFWTTILWSTSLVSNIFLTAIIVLYILRMHAITRDMSHSRGIYLFVAATLGVSPVVYSSWIIAVIVPYLMSNNILNTLIMPSGLIQVSNNQF